uniref:Uncharacterized protein n=1 Tax=Grapevine vein clearing virus TaxID=1050407 RepID=A0A7S6SNK9_9VIRU|nr:hypothetical protein GVCV_gp1 [Grapevine vein clearing virus]
MQSIEQQQFEAEIESWERSERTPLHGYRDLVEYPRYERNQHFPSAKFPCYHFVAEKDNVHATYTKGDRIPQLLNTLYDLQVNQCHNQAVIYDRIQLLARYTVRKGKPLPAIPEESVLKEPEESSTELKHQIELLRADLREIKANQSSLRLAISEIRESITDLTARESAPKPIEAETAYLTAQLKAQVQDIKTALTEIKTFARTLVPER